MSGIRTLDDLRNRCHVDDITGCWHWRGAPRVALPAWRIVTTLPRAARALLDGRLVPSRLYCIVGCSSPDCANPAHIIPCDADRRAQLRRELGRTVTSPRKVASSRRNGSRNRVLTDEQAAEIRVSHETGRALAARYGVSAQTVSKVRRGISSPLPLIPAASAFSWRPDKTRLEAQ